MKKEVCLDHVFPENWKEISTEEAEQHIKYLIDHHKFCDIYEFGKSGIEIDGITFTPMNISLRNGATFKYYLVNMEKTYSADTNAYSLIKKLIKACKIEIKEREEKANVEAAKQAKKDKVKNSIIGVGVGLMIIGGAAFMINRIGKIVDNIHKELDERKKIENAVKQYEENLPNYQEYQQTQQKIANYRDSLERASKQRGK